MQWSGNWVPYGFLACNGATLDIRQYTPLFSIIGIQWGGDGRTTFKLPNLQGKTLAGYGNNAYGVTPLPLSQTYIGTPTASLSLAQIPAHNHSVDLNNANQAVQAKAVVSNFNGSSANPTGLMPAAGFSTSADGLTIDLYKPQTGTSTMALNNSVQLNIKTSINSLSLANTGGTVAHNNMQPYLSMYYVIAWNGMYPDFQ